MRLAFIPPMKPMLVTKPPVGDGWIHEIKLDGFRTQIIIDGADIRAFTKSGADWTRKYTGIVKAARELDVQSAIIEGEAVVAGPDGKPDFAAMQRLVHRDPYARVLGAFDLLHLNGKDLRDLGCEHRREKLQSIVKPHSRIQFSEALPGDGAAIFYLADQAGLEGIVSKRADSKYRSGPSLNWQKTKSYVISDLELLGVERERGLASQAIMADPSTGKYVGSAVISLGRDMKERLWKRVEENAGTPALGLKRPAAQWVAPGTRLRIMHLRGEEKLRHASVLGFSDEQA